MIVGAAVRAYLCREPVDMRRSIDGLAGMIEPVFGADPFSGQLYVFVGKRRDRVKMVLWDRQGFWLFYKRLERGRFPRVEELASCGLSIPELSAWLEGIDLVRTRRLRAVQVSRLA